MWAQVGVHACAEAAGSSEDEEEERACTPEPPAYYYNTLRRASPAVASSVKKTGLTAFLDRASDQVLVHGMLPAMERVATWDAEWEEGDQQVRVTPTLKARVHKMLTGLASLVARGSRQHLLTNQPGGTQLHLGGCPARMEVLAGGLTVHTDDTLCMPYDLAAVRAAKWVAIHTDGYLKLILGKDEEGQKVWEFAHRLLLWAKFGPPTAGEEGSHCCPSRPQPRCLNVLHLRWETHAENEARKPCVRAAARKRKP